MKLRNKKTGLVGELHYEPDKEYHFTVATEDPADMAIYRTLAELNADWEDVPDEPKDQDTIDWLRSENAYLRGKVKAYEEFLTDEGYIKEEE